MAETSSAPEDDSGGSVEVVYYTDPLCSWSWAFEPQWRRLRYAFGDRLTWRYRMGGMIADWDRYEDPINAVNRPLQMGPIWVQVRHTSGMPIDDRIWVEDPPASSYPACAAVKAAELQSLDAGEQYLRRAREAVMLERRNVTRREVLLELADELAGGASGQFDADQFRDDLDSGRATEAFRQDLTEASLRGIGRFPTLTLRRPDAAKGLILVGYRPYDALHAALAKVAPEVQPVRRMPSRDEYAAYWGRITEREIAEATETGASASQSSEQPVHELGQ